MGEHAEVVVDRDAVVAPISPLVWGGLLEHLAECVYGGVWDPVRDCARADVQAAIRALGVTMLRWPGGCFSSWYRWPDGVGPKARRPRHERTHWTDMAAMLGQETAARMGPPEPNLFGTNELLQYCVDIDAEPLLVANIGTGTTEEAADWVRWCNVDRHSPRPVRWWAIGNETWGAHELGHCPPDEYATRFREVAGAMRAVDPTIRIVAAGVTPDQYGLGRDTWAAWNPTLLAGAGDLADALSLHWYFPGMINRPLRDDDADHQQVATGADDLEHILAEVVATHPDIPISLDEWGQMAAMHDHFGLSHRLADAVFFAGCYNAILRHADRVRMATIAQLVNVLAPIQTEGERMYVTAAYLVGLLYRNCARSASVAATTACAEIAVEAMPDLGGAFLASTSARNQRMAPAVDVSATADDRGTTVFVCNRRLDAPVTVEVAGLGDPSDVVLRTVTGPDRWARNDADHPDVLGFAMRAVEVRGGVATVELPPLMTGALMARG